MLRLQPFEIDPLTWAPETARAQRRWFALSSIAALALHLVGGSVLPRSAAPRANLAPLATEVFEIEPPEEPPAPPPALEEPAPDTRPPKIRAAVAAAPRPAAAAPPPAAAGAVLTASPDDAPLDLSNTFVTGNSTSYQGGTTSRIPVVTRAPVAPRGSVAADGAGAGGTPVGPDRSRRATLSGSASWSCPFPQQADLEGINHATSLLSVVVDASGHARTVSILRDPGHGFGAAARACALRRRYNAALDRNGLAIPTTLVLNVRFDR